MKGMLIWILLLLLLYPVNSESCREQDKILEDINNLSNDILLKMKLAYELENENDNFRITAETLTLHFKALENTNNQYTKIVTLLEDQLNGVKENEDVLNTYSKGLEIVLSNKKELIKQLEANNRNLRGEAELLFNELLGRKQNPERSRRISSESYTGSATWQRILLAASGMGDVNEVKFLIHKNVDVNIRDDSPQHTTPLLIAAANGHAQVVRRLLAAGASLDQTSSSLNTALHEAASAGHLQVCQLLLDRNATLEPLNNNKDTPLKLAKQNGHQNVVDLLINKGAKL